MPALIVSLVAVGTLAFGGVYPWAYFPLFGAAGLLGIIGIVRSGIPAERRVLAGALGILWAAVALQVVPLPRGLVDAVSPSTATLLSNFSLAFAADAPPRVPLSINPSATHTAVLALGALAVYVIGVPALLGPAGIRRLPALLAWIAVPVALYGMYTREYNNGLIYGFWRPQDGGGANQFGPFVNRNHFAGWMVMIASLLVGTLFGHLENFFHQRVQRRRTVEWLSSNEGHRLLMIGAAVLVGVMALFWSMSRSAMISFAVAVFAFTWLALGRQRFGRGRRTAVVAIPAVAFLAGVAWRGPATLAAWFQDERDLLSRFDAWRDGWTVVGDFPFTGTGLNTYPTAMLFYQRRNPGWFMAQAHNDYLQLLAEGGLLVVVPAAIAIILLARAIRRNLAMARPEARGYWIRAGAAVGLVGIAVQEFFEFSLQMPVNAFLFCTLAAVALTPTAPPSASA